MLFYPHPTQVKFNENNRFNYGIAFQDKVILADGTRVYNIESLTEGDDDFLVELEWIDLTSVIKNGY